MTPQSLAPISQLLVEKYLRLTRMKRPLFWRSKTNMPTSGYRGYPEVARFVFRQRCTRCTLDRAPRIVKQAFCSVVGSKCFRPRNTSSQPLSRSRYGDRLSSVPFAVVSGRRFSRRNTSSRPLHYLPQAFKQPQSSIINYKALLRFCSGVQKAFFALKHFL